MRLVFRVAASVAVGLVLVVSATPRAQRAGAPASAPGHAAADATARTVTAAQAVVASLDAAGRAKVQFPFDGPQKTRWSNLPSPMFQREGLWLRASPPAQITASVVRLG